MSGCESLRLNVLPGRLERESYPFLRRHPLRYSDMDSFRHLNNVATAALFKDGRAHLNVEVFGPASINDPPPGFQLLFGSITINYVRQAYIPGDAEIRSGIVRIGTTSYIFAQAAFQQDTCFALSQSVMIVASADRPRPITDVERAAMQPFLMCA